MPENIQFLKGFSDLCHSVCHVVEREKGILEHPEYVIVNDELISKSEFFSYNAALPPIAMFSDLLWLKCTDKPSIGRDFVKEEDTLCGVRFDDEVKAKSAWIGQVLQLRKAISDLSSSDGSALDFSEGLSIASTLVGTMESDSFTSRDVHNYIAMNSMDGIRNRIGLNEVQTEALDDILYPG